MAEAICLTRELNSNRSNRSKRWNLFKNYHEKLVQLVLDSVNYSREIKLKPTITEIDVILEAAVRKQLHHAKNAGVELILAAVNEGQKVLVDQRLLEYAVSNIIDAALANKPDFASGLSR